MAVTIEQAKEKALLRLKALGLEDTDEDILTLNLDSTLCGLLSDLNRKELPEGMLHVWADMAAGMTALAVFGTQTDENGEGKGGTVTSIKEGDTSVSYDGATSARCLIIEEARRLISPPASIIARYRRLSW